MKNILELQKKIVPELVEMLEKRYNILRNVYYNEPVGRRSLANKLNLGERVIRTEVNVLKKQGLLKIKSMGMNVTDEGRLIIDELKDFIHNLKDLDTLEENLEKLLDINEVMVVPGKFNENELILKDVGKTASLYIKELLNEKDIIGITGGSTMAQVAEEMPQERRKRDVTVIPARGGLGKDLETQANNVAATLAQKLGGVYKLLHVPDNIGRKALKTLLKIPEINEIVNLTKKLDVLVFGIGRADVMAKRRKLPFEQIEELIENGAVAEAFGYYFNTKGEIVWESSTVGLSLTDFKKINKVIGVACGLEKVEAIISICALRDNMTLITDESTARNILEVVNKAT